MLNKIQHNLTQIAERIKTPIKYRNIFVSAFSKSISYYLLSKKLLGNCFVARNARCIKI